MVIKGATDVIPICASLLLGTSALAIAYLATLVFSVFSFAWVVVRIKSRGSTFSGLEPVFEAA